jgi:hypothetical protein
MALCQKYRIPHSVFLEWDEDDRAKALAFAIEEGQRCQMCGTAPWEWDENKYAYEPTAQLCKGCYLKDTAQEDSKNLPGTTVVLVPSSAITSEDRERRLELERRARRDELEDLRRR